MRTLAIIVYARFLRPLGVRISWLERATWEPWADRFLLPRDHVLRGGVPDCPSCGGPRYEVNFDGVPTGSIFCRTCRRG